MVALLYEVVSFIPVDLGELIFDEVIKHIYKDYEHQENATFFPTYLLDLATIEERHCVGK